MSNCRCWLAQMFAGSDRIWRAIGFELRRVRVRKRILAVRLAFPTVGVAPMRYGLRQN